MPRAAHTRAARKRKAKPPPKQAKRPAHRPSEYTPLKAERCIEHFREGGVRHEMGAKNNLPEWPTFQRWMESRPDLRYQYARALEDQANALFEEAVHVARDCNAEDANAARVKADVFLRAAARRKPKVYLERVVAEEIAAEHRLQVFERRAAERGAALQAGQPDTADADETPNAPPARMIIEIVEAKHDRPAS